MDQVGMGWGGSCRGGMAHVGGDAGWGGGAVGHAGVGWSVSCRGGVGHAGMGWGGSCRGGVGCVM